MVKSINFLNKLIFNYLGKENTAILLSQTGFFMDCELNDGVLWAQFDDNNQITAVISGDNERCVAFASGNADFEELSFVINGTILSSDNLPYKRIDKKYLMHVSLENVIGEKGIKYTQYSKIEKLNDKLTPEHTVVKKFLNLNGCCEGAVIEKGLHTISELKHIRDSIKIFMDTPQEECLKRRVIRDMSKYNMNEDEIRRYFYEIMIPQYKKYIEYQKDEANIIVSNSNLYEVIKLIRRKIWH